MKLLLIILLMSCGRIKIDDVNVRDSIHTVEHRIVLDGDVNLFTTKCENEYPDNLKKQQDCIDGYLDALDAVLQIEGMNLSNDTIEL